MSRTGFDQIVGELSAFVENHGGPSFEVVPASSVHEAEMQLGFTLPALLVECYKRVGNGGFCEFDGFIGIGDGYQSDFGDLVSTHKQLASDWHREGKKWPDGMLPVFEWGCNRYSCVDCSTLSSPIYDFDDFELHSTEADLATFLKRWMEGEGDPEKGVATGGTREVEIVNPFTKRIDTVKFKEKKPDEGTT